MKRRILAFFLAFSLCLGLGGQAFAARGPEEETAVGYSSGRVEREDLAPNYVSGRLSGVDRAMYNLLWEKFAQVANGQLDSSIFKFNVSGLGIYHIREGELSADINAAVYAILLDCPYEQYWLEKTKGWSFEWSYNTSTKLVSTITVKCHTTEDYAQSVPGENSYYIYKPDTGKTKAAAAAMDNARDLVRQNSGKSDYEKLTAYKDYICSQVEYDYDAVKNEDYYGAPWQLINAFDNNPNTNVVCEGYAKAFKYLCDLSTFTNDISCYLVTGYTGEAHMWNTVRVNGQSYLVDVTACDSLRGQFGDWFLAGAPNATANGFTLQLPRRTLSDGRYFEARTDPYTYKDETKQRYSSDILILSSTGLDPAALSTPQPPAQSGLKTAFKDLTLHELSASGSSADDQEYTLGSTGADVSVLILGSYDCADTARTLKTVKAEMADLGVRGGRIYLVEVYDEGPAGQSAVRQWARENPSYVRVVASDNTHSPYDSVFWDVTEACDGEYADGEIASMPAVVVLDKDCQPVYYASCKTFEQSRLRAALSAYAGSFDDVDSGKFYAKAVNWAVSGNVTTGTTSTRFSPAKTCTHAEIITFLWRAMGEPKSSSFVPPSWVGVQSGHYAYNALGWASAKGMLANLSANGGPDGYCTRAQAMDYIWAAFGRPSGGSASFSDIPSHMYYAGAVSWAVENGVTNGTGGGRFSPDTVCDRGTIVTFLHRAFVEEARVK